MEPAFLSRIIRFPDQWKLAVSTTGMPSTCIPIESQ